MDEVRRYATVTDLAIVEIESLRSGFLIGGLIGTLVPLLIIMDKSHGWNNLPDGYFVELSQIETWLVLQAIVHGAIIPVHFVRSSLVMEKVIKRVKEGQNE
jgi:hypothetical protein